MKFAEIVFGSAAEFQTPLWAVAYRSVVNCEGSESESGRSRSSHQTVSQYTLRQRFPNTQQSRFLTACRRLEKLVLRFIFDMSFILDDVKLSFTERM